MLDWGDGIIYMNSVYNKIDRLSKRILKLRQEQYLLRKSLADKCVHPNPENWKWEHDNGYGKQTMIDGLRCKYCGAEKRWLSSSYWTRDGEMLL